MLYEVRDPKTNKILKIGIGKTGKDIDTMKNGSNRRAHNSARAVMKDKRYPNAISKVIDTYKDITKGQMKEIEAKKVRALRAEGHELPYNRERDKRYQSNEKSGGCLKK